MDFEEVEVADEGAEAPRILRETLVSMLHGSVQSAFVAPNLLAGSAAFVSTHFSAVAVHEVRKNAVEAVSLRSLVPRRVCYSCAVWNSDPGADHVSAGLVADWKDALQRWPGTSSACWMTGLVWSWV
jgi:hypothetical protein